MKSYSVHAIVVIAISIVLHSTSSLAVTNVVEISEIVVSASKFGEETWRSGSSVSVIPESIVQSRRATSTAGLVHGEAGVNAFNATGIPGGGQTISFRGLRASETLLQVDGLRYNRPLDGEANLVDLPPLLLGPIELLKGAQSSLYGSDSMGGVVSLSTPAGHGKPSVGSSFEMGTYDYRREKVFTQGKIKAFDWNMGYQRLDTDNDRPNSQYRQDAAAMRLGYDVMETLRADVMTRFSDGTDGTPGSITTNDPRTRLMRRMVMVSPQVVIEPFEEYESKLILGYITVGQKYDAPSSAASRTLSHTESLQLNWQNTMKFTDWNTLVAGVEARKEQLTTGLGGLNHNVFGRSTQGYFLSDSIRVDDWAGTTLSGRFDDNEKYQDVRTYRASQIFKLPVTDTRLHGSFGTGFRAPTMQELNPTSQLTNGSTPFFNPVTASTVGAGQTYFVNNPGLVPERSEGFDFGFTQPFLDQSLEWDSTYFYNNMVNMILLNSNFIYQNFSETRTEGVESSLKWKASKQLSLKTSFTFISTTLKNSSNSGLDFARTPREQASIQLDWAPVDHWSLAWIYHAVGTRFDTVSNVRELNSYHRLDFVTSYDLSSYFTIFGRAENLMGYRYQSAANYPALGRTFYGGFELKY